MPRSQGRNSSNYYSQRIPRLGRVQAGPQSEAHRWHGPAIAAALRTPSVLVALTVPLVSTDPTSGGNSRNLGQKTTSRFMNTSQPHFLKILGATIIF